MGKQIPLGGFDGPLDETDWAILKIVQSEARASYADIGRKVNLSPPAVAERLRRLEDAGVIAGYRAEVNPASLGLEMTVIMDLHVKRTDYARFHRAAQKLPWIVECHHVSGRASFVLKAVVPNVAGMEMLIGHLSQFGETQTSVVLSTVIGRRAFGRMESAE